LIFLAAIPRMRLRLRLRQTGGARPLLSRVHPRALRVRARQATCAATADIGRWRSQRARRPV